MGRRKTMTEKIVNIKKGKASRVTAYQLMLPEGPAILFKKRERNIPSDADSQMP
jgi:hypothetical protein